MSTSAATPTTSDQSSIQVRELTKDYGTTRALRGISFTIQPGEVVGFLGPNGAGKTTTMKILTCFMDATSGQASVAGHDVHGAPDEVRRRIGYLPENVPLYDEMLVWDYLRFIAEIRGVPRAQRAQRAEQAIARAGLDGVVGRAVSELSKGYRQRVGLAQAIIHEPEVVILDEPTTGLDPNQIVEIRDVITDIGASKTVLFSTHIMQEVAAVCDRIIIINQGQIVADDTLEGLSARLGQGGAGLHVELADAQVTPSQLERALDAQLPGLSVQRSARSGARPSFVLQAPDAEALERALYRAAADGRIRLERVGPTAGDLEAIFRAFTGGSTEENLAGLAPGGAAPDEEQE